jgi:hypothetical protein
MTKLRLVHSNPNPTLTLRLAPPLRLVDNRPVDREFEEYKAKLTAGGGLVSRRFEWCKNWRDILEEWDDIMWVLPPSERASQVRTGEKKGGNQ